MANTLEGHRTGILNWYDFPIPRHAWTGMPIRLAGDAGRFRRLDILVRRTTVVFPLVFSTSNNRAKLQESNNVFH